MAKDSLGDRIWYKYWPPQVPKCLDYPDCTLAEFLTETAAKHGSKPAILFLDAQVTYQELWEKVQRFATALAELGLKKGDVCALMLRLNWSSQRNSKRALEMALSRYCAPGWPLARSAACAAIL